MRRVLIAFDGTSWFVRRIAYVAEDWNTGEIRYHCDKHLGGPYKTAGAAVRGSLTKRAKKR